LTYEWSTCRTKWNSGTKSGKFPSTVTDVKIGKKDGEEERTSKAQVSDKDKQILHTLLVPLEFLIVRKRT